MNRVLDRRLRKLEGPKRRGARLIALDGCEDEADHLLAATGLPGAVDAALPVLGSASGIIQGASHDDFIRLLKGAH